MVDDVYGYLKKRFEIVRPELLKSSTIEDFLERYEDELRYVWADYGSSKLVLFFTELDDIVVKIPLSGDEENQLYVGSYSDCVWDYCQYESTVYKKAIAANLAHIFASTVFLGYVGLNNNIPIYISEKVYDWDELCDFKPKCSDEEADMIVSNSKNYYKIGNFESLYALCRCYGIKEFVNLFKFLTDNHVNDLRISNIGRRKDGSIVLIDYSGWYD